MFLHRLGTHYLTSQIGQEYTASDQQGRIRMCPKQLAVNQLKEQNTIKTDLLPMLLGAKTSTLVAEDLVE